MNNNSLYRFCKLEFLYLKKKNISKVEGSLRNGRFFSRKIPWKDVEMARGLNQNAGKAGWEEGIRAGDGGGRGAGSGDSSRVRGASNLRQRGLD